MKRALLLACLAWGLTASAQLPSYVPTDGLVAWYPFNGNGSNLIGFDAIPAGYRAANGAGHRNGGGLSYFWTSTMNGSELYRRVLTYSRTDILRSTYPIENYGFSVRCVKD